jgi:hypothetical protein
LVANGAIPNLAEAGLSSANMNKETATVINWVYFIDLFLRRGTAPATK